MAQPLQEKRKRIHIETPFEDEYIYVHFVGDDTFTNNILETHKNPGYEICLIPYGKGFFKIDSTVYPIGIGQLFMTRASQSHAGWPSPKHPYRIRYFCFEIKPSALANPKWAMIQAHLNSVTQPTAFAANVLQEIHSRILSEITGSGFLKKEILSVLFEDFILTTIRNFAGTGREERRDNGYIAARPTLSGKIMELVNSSWNEPLTLESIAVTLNYSTSYLCRTFREETGFTIMEYFNFVRLESSRSDLLLAGTSISDIAEKYGYKTIHHYSKAFKNLYSLSPAQFRKQYTAG